MKRLFSLLKIVALVALIIWLVVNLLEYQAHKTLVERQRMAIGVLRDSIDGERNTVFKQGLSKGCTYIYKLERGNFSFYFAAKFQPYTEGMLVTNPVGGQKTLILQKALNESRQLVNYFTQDNLILKEGQITAMVSRVMFDSITQSNSIGIKIDSAESILMPEKPDNPYDEKLLDICNFNEKGEAVIRAEKIDSSITHVKINDKDVFPKLNKASFKNGNGQLVYIWFLNDRDFPIIVKVKDGDTVLKLKSISNWKQKKNIEQGTRNVQF